MKVFEKKLYEELRDLEQEILSKLENNLIDKKIKSFVEAELRDVECTLRRLECGEYGKCEMSGELIPYDILNEVPTVKAISDLDEMKRYCKKPYSYY